MGDSPLHGSLGSSSFGLIEKEPAGVAALNATEEDLQQLELCSVPPAGDDAAVVQKWYLAFHNTLAKAAHNEFLERAMVTIRGEMFVGVPPEGEQPDVTDLVVAYRGIFEAVRDRDQQRAMRITADYHEYLYRLLWERGTSA